MKISKLLNLFVLSLLVVSSLFAQKYMTLEELKNMNKKPKAEKELKKDTPKVVSVPPRTGMKVDLVEAETLAEGSYSNIEKPFIYIARTENDYSKLKNLIEGFESSKEIDFKKQAVVVAFAGMKSSGGYSISIYKLQGRTNIIVNDPPKDAIVTSALTYPYKVTVIDIQEEDSLNIAASEEFQNEMTTYKVTSSQFKIVGGFIGRELDYTAEGTIGMLKYDDFVTFAFDLKGKENASNFVLNEMASGIMSDSSAKIARVEAGSFMARPHPPLNVIVSIRDNVLSMKFEPGKRDYIVNDGYEGRGSLEAEKVQK